MTMGLWAGGLAAFLSAPDRRFGLYAIPLVAITVVSGVLLAFAHTRFGGALFTTDYGRVLLLKVVIAGAALGTAALRRHRAEFAIVMIVLAGATLLAVLPPPF